MPGSGESPESARECGALQRSADDRGGSGAGGAPAEVHVLGQAGPAVAEWSGSAGRTAWPRRGGWPRFGGRCATWPRGRCPVEGLAQVSAWCCSDRGGDLSGWGRAPAGWVWGGGGGGGGGG